MFAAARALLLSRGVDAKTHRGLLSEIGRLFVKPGILGIDFSTSLREARELRENVDYGGHVIVTEDEARQVVADAEAFVLEAGRILAP